MKTYREVSPGIFQDGGKNIPSDPNNADRARMLAEIEAGEAQVIAYVAPVPDYAELRRREYPPMAEQLDALWKGGAAETAMRTTIMAIKTRYPKP